LGTASANGLRRDIDKTVNTVTLSALEVGEFLNTLEGEYALFHEIYIANLMCKKFGEDVGVHINNLRTALRQFESERGLFTSGTLDLKRPSLSECKEVNKHVRISYVRFGRHNADLWFTVDIAAYQYIAARKLRIENLKDYNGRTGLFLCCYLIYSYKMKIKVANQTSDIGDIGVTSSDPKLTSSDPKLSSPKHDLTIEQIRLASLVAFILEVQCLEKVPRLSSTVQMHLSSYYFRYFRGSLKRNIVNWPEDT